VCDLPFPGGEMTRIRKCVQAIIDLSSPNQGIEEDQAMNWVIDEFLAEIDAMKKGPLIGDAEVYVNVLQATLRDASAEFSTSPEADELLDRAEHYLAERRKERG
jgi:hypothetical protein